MKWAPGSSARLTFIIVSFITCLSASVGARASGMTARDLSGGGRFQDTSVGIHVFDDQLIEPLPPALATFVATHYDGSQKDPAAMVDALHGINPAFVVLQYRLGIGLGYRTSVNGCDQAGDWISILDGDQWVREWPKDPQGEWFYHRHGKRVYSCGNGWFLTDPNDAAYRTWFLGQLSQQIADTHTDGAFLDSVSVPNYLGSGDAWKPPLPPLAPRFERRWSKRIDAWLPWITNHLAEPVIVNAGTWITSRDATDYRGATGIMVEGFAEPCSGCPLAPSDWVLQMNRTLSEVSLGRVVIGQAYPDVSDVQMRMFVLGSYLLVKGTHTFVNLEIGFSPEWFPEYGIDLGRAVDPVPSSIEDLRSQGAYARQYEKGLVVVNPGDVPVTYALHGSMYLVTPVGGGTVPDDGMIPPSWKLTYSQVSSVTLAPRSSAILVAAHP